MLTYPLLTALLILSASMLFAELVAEKSGINKPLCYLLTGFLISELLTSNGIDTHIRADNFSAIIFQGLLPVILFEMTLSLVKPEKRELTKSSGLALYLLFCFVPVSSSIIYLFMAHPNYFPPVAAVLLVAIIAAVEPACSRLNESSTNISHPVRSQIEVETLINDALAAILFSFALMIAQGQLQSTQLGGEVIIALAKLVLGGLFVGLLCGYLIVKLKRWCYTNTSHLLLSVTLAYASYFAAEALIGASGVVAVLSAGLIFRVKLSKDVFFRPLKRSWNNIGYYADAWLFFLLGMTFTLDMFSERWLAMLIVVFALIVGRIVAGYSGYLLFKPYYQRVSPKLMLNGIIAGNYSGALAIALVLSLPEELPYWWTIQAMVFGVVLYSLLFQLPLFNFINRKFKR